MPPKLNVPTEASSNKNSVKTKKRTSKTKRSSKSSVKSKDSTTNNKKLENKMSTNSSKNLDNLKGKYSNSSYPRSSYSTSNNVRMSLSEIVVDKMDRIDSANNSINSDTYCKYQCSCRALKKCKEKLDFNLLTHNGIPVKMMYHGSKEENPGKSYNINSNNSIHQDIERSSVTSKISANENLHSSKSNKRFSHDSYKSSQTNISRRISHDPSNLYNSQHNFYRRNSQDFEDQQNAPSYSKCSACINCQHSRTSISKCSLLSPKQSRPCKCNCIYCQKISPTWTSPLRSVRNSFSSSQSCPQLDVIKEEVTESEDIQNKTHRSSMEVQSKPESRSKSTASNTLKAQKTLEDTCADFLNIVCDNILESVQKSVECKLKEFSGQSTEKLENLGEKLDKSEEAVRSYCCEIMKKMTEQNNSNFQKLYSLIQNLMETKAANQYPMARSTYQDKECQYEPVIKEENNIIKEHLDDKIDVVKDVKNGKYKKEGCGCCHCSIEEEPTHKLVVHKSYSNNIIKGKFDHSPYLAKENKSTQSVHLDEIKAGDYGNSKSSKIVSKEKDKAKLAETIKYPSKEIAIPNIPSPQETNEELSKNIDLSLKFPPLEVIPSNNLFPRGLTTKSQSIEEDLNIIDLPIMEHIPTEVASAESFSKFESKEKDIQIMDVSIKYPPPEIISSSFDSGKELLNHKSIYSSQREISSQSYTVFSQTPSGKTIDITNNSTNDKNPNLQTNFPNIYDNYDTSGYTTEPEDNNDNASSNSSRKKLQKKASKQHCNSQSSASVTLQDINSGSDGKSDGSESGRRLSKTHSPKDYNSSPTRLSRL